MTADEVILPHWALMTDDEAELRERLAALERAAEERGAAAMRERCLEVCRAHRSTFPPVDGKIVGAAACYDSIEALPVRERAAEEQAGE